MTQPPCDRRARMETAHHEAGHAVAWTVLLRNRPIARIELIPNDEKARGHVGPFKLGLAEPVGELAVILAGVMAADLAAGVQRFDCGSLAGSDRMLAARICGVDPELLTEAAPPMPEAIKLAAKVLEEKWPAVEAVAHRLYHVGSVNHAEVKIALMEVRGHATPGRAIPGPGPFVSKTTIVRPSPGLRAARTIQTLTRTRPAGVTAGLSSSLEYL